VSLSVVKAAQAGIAAPEHVHAPEGRFLGWGQIELTGDRFFHGRIMEVTIAGVGFLYIEAIKPGDSRQCPPTEMLYVRASDICTIRFTSEAVLKHTLGTITIGVPNIQDAVCRFFGIPLHAMAAKKDGMKGNDYAYPRMIAMMLSREAGYSMQAVGKWFRRDHTTVVYACKRVPELMLTVVHVKSAVEHLRKELGLV
jgi:hypothetical protein